MNTEEKYNSIREDDISFYTIENLVDSYRSWRISPVELVRKQFERIDRFEPAINSFIYLEREQALDAARESEARYAAGRSVGPLDGVTFSVKDSFSIAGRPSRKGSRATPAKPATLTSPAVASCLDAGAIFIGATTMPEFGIGPLTTSPLTGVTTNPWNTALHAGGSSGGAAASVAAGFSTFALGTDAGGSNRIPAALTGTVGFKPSTGRVSSFPASGAGGLSCPGPIARSVHDVATVMNVIAHYDPRDPTALPECNVDYEAELTGKISDLKFAYSATLGFAKLVHAEVAAQARDAAFRIGRLGATVEEADPEIEDPVSYYVNLMHAGNQYSLRNLTDADKAVLSPGIRRMLDGEPVGIRAYLDAQERARNLNQAMSQFHRRFDILVTPAVAAPAFAANLVTPPEYDGFENKRAWTPFVSAFNLSQQPAISIPIGLTSDGLPIGLQLVAPRFGDALLLRVADAIEREWPFLARPDLVLQTAGRGGQL